MIYHRLKRLSKITVIFLVNAAEDKNGKLQSELRKMDTDFENELKERETIVNELKTVESGKKGDFFGGGIFLIKK